MNSEPTQGGWAFALSSSEAGSFFIEEKFIDQNDWGIAQNREFIGQNNDLSFKIEHISLKLVSLTS